MLITMKSFAARCSGILFLAVLVVSARNEDPTTRGRLYQKLFDNYNGEVAPPNYVDVKFELAVICAAPSADGKDVKSTVLEIMMWNDERLQWDPTKFDGISKLHISNWRVWNPDISLYNTVDVSGVENMNIEISSTGDVMWCPRMKHSTQCSPHKGNLRCNMQFGSWVYDNAIMNITGLSETYQPEYDGFLDTSVYFTTCPKLTNISVIRELRTYPGFENPWVIIVYNFDVEIEKQTNE